MDYEYTLVCFTSAIDFWKVQENAGQDMHLSSFLLLCDNTVQNFRPVVKLFLHEPAALETRDWSQQSLFKDQLELLYKDAALFCDYIFMET